MSGSSAQTSAEGFCMAGICGVVGDALPAGQAPRYFMVERANVSCCPPLVMLISTVMIWSSTRFNVVRITLCIAPGSQVCSDYPSVGISIVTLVEQVCATVACICMTAYALSESTKPRNAYRPLSAQMVCHRDRPRMLAGTGRGADLLNFATWPWSVVQTR